MGVEEKLGTQRGEEEKLGLGKGGDGKREREVEKSWCPVHKEKKGNDFRPSMNGIARGKKKKQND